MGVWACGRVLVVGRAMRWVKKIRVKLLRLFRLDPAVGNSVETSQVEKALFRLRYKKAQFEL